jgi:O-methyltransferase
MKTKNDPEFRVRMKTLLEEGTPVWQNDQTFIKYYNEIENVSLVSPYRCFYLYQFAKNANSLKGQFAQVGVYRGGSAKMISFVKEKSKKLYLFDTFTGLPKTNPRIDGYKQGKFSDTSLDEVQALFSKDNTVEVVAGLFPDSGKCIKNEKFAFVYIDVDLYKSNYESLDFFYKRMVPGGVIIFDDYDWRYCSGIKKSVQDFIKRNKIKETPIVTTMYQCVIIKA